MILPFSEPCLVWPTSAQPPTAAWPHIYVRASYSSVPRGSSSTPQAQGQQDRTGQDMTEQGRTGRGGWCPAHPHRRPCCRPAAPAPGPAPALPHARSPPAAPGPPPAPPPPPFPSAAITGRRLQVVAHVVAGLAASLLGGHRCLPGEEPGKPPPPEEEEKGEEEEEEPGPAPEPPVVAQRPLAVPGAPRGARPGPGSSLGAAPGLRGCLPPTGCPCPAAGARGGGVASWRPQCLSAVCGAHGPLPSMRTSVKIGSTRRK